MSEGTQYSIHSVCRICLIYLGHSPNFTHDLFQKPDLAEMLTMCTGVRVEPKDGFPKYLCDSCFGRLDDMHDFQKMCVDSVQKFREMLAQNMFTCHTVSSTSFDVLNVVSNEGDVEGELAGAAEEDRINFDPLQNHKMEMIENEEEVIKLLETVDKEQSSSDDDLPLAQRWEEEQQQRSKPKRKLPTILTCHICQKKFKMRCKFDEHMKHHNELLPFQCPENSCKKGFTTASALRLHVDYAHTKQSAEIPCSVDGCKLVFPRVRLLTIHLKKVHNLNRPSGGPRLKQPCSECGMVFRCPGALKKHMYKHTGKELPYPCNICGKGFHINSALKNHLLRHAGIKNYVCPYCGVGKTTRQEWSKHMLTHTQEKQFKCEICAHATHTKRALDNHVKIVHEKIRNFACQYCGKTFGKSHACKIHEMTHTGEKRCECKVCGKKFLYTESLTKHLKIHEKSVERSLETYRQRQGQAGLTDIPQADATDHLLKVCAESVATIPRDPRRVERVDISKLAGTVLNPIPTVSLPTASFTAPPNPKDKEGMHLCPGCGQGFTNLGNMKRHYKSVHEKVKDFECRFCSRRFANSQSLKQHEWIHTGEKPYACKICGNHFRQEAALIRHQRVHDEKPPKPVKPPKEITEKVREKKLQKDERRRQVEALRQEIAEVAKEELKDLAKQKALEKQQNTYEQYQAAAEEAGHSKLRDRTMMRPI